MAQWGEQPQGPADPEQAAILASLNAQRFQRFKEEEREFVNNMNLEHALEISRQRAATEEAGRLLMAAERQLNAHRHAEAFAREAASKRDSPRTRQHGDSAAGKLLRRQPPCSNSACFSYEF